MRITLIRGPNGKGDTYRQDYDLPDLPASSVSNALQYISRQLDGSVAYYLSCRRGLCAACVVRINGRNEKACVVQAYDGMVVEATNVKLLIKDSVVHLGMPKKCSLEIESATFRCPPPQCEL